MNVQTFSERHSFISVAERMHNKLIWAWKGQTMCLTREHAAHQTHSPSAASQCVACKQQVENTQRKHVTQLFKPECLMSPEVTLSNFAISTTLYSCVSYDFQNKHLQVSVRNHCCRRKAISITHLCVCAYARIGFDVGARARACPFARVTLIIPHATRMRSIVCGLTGSTQLFDTIS
jgi:hypothetical protein